MNTVAIAGVGLIGGSFALALRKAGFRGQILGVSPESVIEVSLKMGVINAGVTLEQAARVSDLIYLAQPIEAILDSLPLLNQWVRPEALVTDSGSTKVAIVEKAGKFLTRCEFLGGHPLAGKETRGVQSADSDLFQGRTYVLTPSSPERNSTKALMEFTEWLRRIGATPVQMTPAEHDRVLANTSHLPQLASTALASYLGKQGREVQEIFGPALLELTRLSLSPFEIWTDIVSTNRSEIDRALAGYIHELEQLRQRLSSSDTVPVRDAFAQGERFARKLRNPHSTRDFDFF